MPKKDGLVFINEIIKYLSADQLIIVVDKLYQIGMTAKGGKVAGQKQKLKLR